MNYLQTNVDLLNKDQESAYTSSSSSSGYTSNQPVVNTEPTFTAISGDFRVEENRARETLIAQRLLSLPINDHQHLIAKGMLTKICRRKPKNRCFYLFNDTLAYAGIVYGKLISPPHVFRLSEVSIAEIDDSGIFRNGFAVETPKKSFSVYATIKEEKRRWVESLKTCINETKRLTGLAPKELDGIKKSPVWIPNSEAMHCMVCLTTEFSLVTRRHHCRNCGKVVCSKCSNFRWVLPSQGPGQLRICRECHETLKNEQQNQTNAVKPPPVPPHPTAAPFQHHLSSSQPPCNDLPVLAPLNWYYRLEGSKCEQAIESDDSASGNNILHALTES